MKASSLIFYIRLFVDDKPNNRLGKALEESIHREKCACPEIYTYRFGENKMECKKEPWYSCNNSCFCKKGSCIDDKDCCSKFFVNLLMSFSTVQSVLLLPLSNRIVILARTITVEKIVFVRRALTVH